LFNLFRASSQKTMARAPFAPFQLPEMPDFRLSLWFLANKPWTVPTFAYLPWFLPAIDDNAFLHAHDRRKYRRYVHFSVVYGRICALAKGACSAPLSAIGYAPMLLYTCSGLVDPTPVTLRSRPLRMGCGRGRPSSLSLPHRSPRTHSHAIMYSRLRLRSVERVAKASLPAPCWPSVTCGRAQAPARFPYHRREADQSPRARPR